MVGGGLNLCVGMVVFFNFHLVCGGPMTKWLCMGHFCCNFLTWVARWVNCFPMFEIRSKEKIAILLNLVC